MTWNYRRAGDWSTPTPKVRKGGQWVTVGGGGGGGGGGSGDITVGNPGSTIFESPMDTQTEIERFHERSHTSNVSIAADPEGQHGDVTSIFVGANDTRGATIAWAPREQRDGTRTGENDPDAVYAQNHIYFPSDAQMYDSSESNHGTKISGIAGFYDDAGNGGTPGNGYSWSARCQTDVIEESSSNSGFTMNYFPYHMDQGGSYGDKEPWDGEYAFGEWHTATHFVQMNTPGEANGILRGWMNGNLAYEREDYRFRDTDHPDVGVTRAWGGYIYWGGTWGSPQDQNVYFRDFSLANG